MIEGVPRGLTLFRFRSGSRARLQFVGTPRLGLREGDERRGREDAGCSLARGFDRINVEIGESRLCYRYRCTYQRC